MFDCFIEMPNNILVIVIVKYIFPKRLERADGVFNIIDSIGFHNALEFWCVFCYNVAPFLVCEEAVRIANVIIVPTRKVMEKTDELAVVFACRQCLVHITESVE